ncbi:hypothetical protein [Falsiruegeria mediterranea]|uniref:hypothetical protein n=1 Tax=Falsiruegeria mediterranea TaxID=1280832 RepID=UPI0015F29775|nr:hypothetical protein [Falsiruegeria mediterranea]
MTHWTREYVLAVLERQDWSMNRLATEIGVAATTINRPLKSKDASAGLSAKTISKIYETTGVDPSEFAPVGMSEPIALYMEKPQGRRPETTADRALKKVISSQTGEHQEQKIAIVGDLVQVAATVDKDGLEKLIKRLNLIHEAL